MFNARKKESKKVKITNIAVVWFLAIIAMAALVVGQADVAEETVVLVNDNNPQEQTPAELLNNPAIQSISFDKDRTIKEGLRLLALRYKKNIVPTPAVEGPITATNLYDVTFEEALTAILGVKNKYDVQGNFIMVYTHDEYEEIKNNKRRMEHKVFTLYYLTADEALKLVTPLLSEDGELAASSPAETGVPVGKSISSDSGGDNLAFEDTIVMKDYPENIADAQDVIKQLDKRPKQVLIEATILAATLTEDMDFGVDLNFMAGASLGGADPIGQIDSVSGTPLETTGFAKVGANGMRIGITAGDLRVFITALEEITDTTILANPKILAVNKQLGQVYIGTKLGYRNNDVITDGGATQQGKVEFLDTGTKLSFRPYIGDDGYIRMQIHPKDSSGALNAQGVPDETSAELSTNIMVRDGQTIVIGGLFRDVVTSGRKQVPLLGDIPIIGAAFQGRNDSTIRQEIIVLLTPHIIEDPEELNGDERAADIARKRHGAIRGQFWIGAGRLAEESYAKAVSYYYEGETDAAMCELNWTINLRPTYLEALRLRERIILESNDESTLERIMIEAIEQEESEKWLRR